MKKTIQATLFYILLIVTLSTATTIESHAANKPKTDKQVISEYIKTTYGSGYKVAIRKGGTIDKQLLTRTGKKIIYVEKIMILILNIVNNAMKIYA